MGAVTLAFVGLPITFLAVVLIAVARELFPRRPRW